LINQWFVNQPPVYATALTSGKLDMAGLALSSGRSTLKIYHPVLCVNRPAPWRSMEYIGFFKETTGR
jgi:hypothetical protein